VDGLVLAHDTPRTEPESLAALTAAALGVALRLTDATGRGDLRELLLRGEQGYVATYAAGSSAVLTLLAQDRVNVGRLHLEGRRAGSRIGELVDAVGPRADPAERPTGTEPSVNTRAGEASATTAGAAGPAGPASSAASAASARNGSALPIRPTSQAPNPAQAQQPDPAPAPAPPPAKTTVRSTPPQVRTPRAPTPRTTTPRITPNTRSATEN
jgi:predicted regulator of Ras-like GTPase activity (Roadblock/LC7/MglB family)